jgi:chorismate synthase
VAVGAVCRKLLAEFGIQVGGYVLSIGAVQAGLDDMPYAQRFAQAEESEVRCPDPQASEGMRARIREIMTERDTLGGVVEVVALGCRPAWARTCSGTGAWKRGWRRL